MKEKMGWPGVLGVFVVLGTLSILVLTATGMWPFLAGVKGDSWAAWVQAVGTVVALFMTGGLAVWEARQRRREESIRVADQLRARVAVLQFACEAVATFARQHEEKQFAMATGTYVALESAIEVADSVNVRDMPTQKCVINFFIFAGCARPFRDVIANHKPAWLHPNMLARLAPPWEGMRNAVEAMKAEADRLERGGE